MIAVLGLAVLGLDGHQRSNFGDGIIEMGKYGATAFPIIFAAIVARLFKAIALWRCEKGAKLGLLEQLVGSQSLGATVERYVLLRRFDILGAIVVLIWFLSPLGSQMSLRLLVLTSVDNISQTQVRYFNTTTPGGPSWAAFVGGSFISYARPSLTALVSANMLASTKVLTSPVDQWNNVKVPRLDAMAYSAEGSENLWIPITNGSNMTWASLSGLMIEGLNASGNSTFLLKTSYIDFICSDAMQTNISSVDFIPDVLKSVGLAVHIVNASSPFSSDTNGQSVWSSLFLDTNSKVFTPFDAPQNLFYVTRATFFEDTPNSLYIFNCSYTTPKVETNVTCMGQDCAITAIRRWEDPPFSPLQPPFNWDEYVNMLLFVPRVLGYAQSGTTSPLDQYVLGSDAPLSVSATVDAPNISRISGATFGKRLTTLINTVWQANLAPFAIPLGSSTNFSVEEQSLGFVPSANATATNVQRFENVKYVANRSHAILLIVITIVLQSCAVIGLVLKERARAPDILGYVSSMTRDNVHTALPSGGNSLDGAERARYLYDLRVQLADVRPGEEVGHIVLCSVDNDYRSKVGRLDRGRLYL